jgi:hypothetical protein
MPDELDPIELALRFTSESVGRAEKFLDQKKIDFRVINTPGCNASAIERATSYDIRMSSQLVTTLRDISLFFQPDVLQTFGHRKNLDWRAALFAAITGPGEKGRDNIVLFKYALHFVFGHEVGHLRQGHTAAKIALGLPTTVSEWNETCEDGEGPLNSQLFVFELAADYEAIQFCIPLLLRKSSTDAEKMELDIRSLWLLVCSITLLFFLFERMGRARPPFGFIGTHPAPASRLLWLVRTIVRVLEAQRIVAIADTARIFDYLVDAVDFSTHFWHSMLVRNGVEVSVPEIHPTLSLAELPEYGNWQACMSEEWNKIMPTINENIVKGHKLPVWTQSQVDKPAWFDMTKI